MSVKKKSFELKPQDRNANRGTERGAFQLEESLKRYGAGRSIVVDKNGTVIAGSHTLETWGDKPVELVRTSGEKLVVVLREDLDLDNDEGGKARALAIADNRTSETGLQWDTDVLSEEIAAGLDVGFLFREDELAAILKKQEKDEKAAAEGGGGGDLKTVKLPMTSAQFEEFSELLKKLMEDYGSVDVVATVMEALRNEAGGGRA